MIDNDNDLIIKSIHIKPAALFHKSSSRQRPKSLDGRPKSAQYMARPYTPSGLIHNSNRNSNSTKLSFDKSLITSPSKMSPLSSLASPINRDDNDNFITNTITSPVSPPSPNQRRPLTLCIDPHEICVSRTHKKMNIQGELRLRNLEKEKQWSSVDKVKDALIKTKTKKNLSVLQDKLHHTVISHHSSAFRKKNVEWGKDCFVHDLYEPRRHEIFKGRAIWQGFCNDPIFSPSLGFIQR